MTHIDWNPKLTIDLPTIDEQHKKLIDLSNGLLQAMVNGMGQDVLEDLFKELREYTDYHFKDEEKLMQEMGYPGLADQQAAHKSLIEDVDKFHEQLMRDELSPNDALGFINEWIVNHIQEMDSKVADYAKNR